MKIVAAVTDPASVRRYLKGVGLPAESHFCVGADLETLEQRIAAEPPRS